MDGFCPGTDHGENIYSGRGTEDRRRWQKERSGQEMRLYSNVRVHARISLSHSPGREQPKVEKEAKVSSPWGQNQQILAVSELLEAVEKEVKND